MDPSSRPSARARRAQEVRGVGTVSSAASSSVAPSARVAALKTKAAKVTAPKGSASASSSSSSSGSTPSSSGSTPSSNRADESCDLHKQWDEFLFHQRHICVLFQSVMHPRRHPKRFVATVIGWTAFCAWLPFWNASLLSLLCLCTAALAIPVHYILVYQRNMKSKQKKIGAKQRAEIDHLASKIASAHGSIRGTLDRLSEFRTSRPLLYVLVVLGVGTSLYLLFSWIISDIMFFFLIGLWALFVLSDSSVSDILQALHVTARPHASSSGAQQQRKKKLH